jgi:hypothetical protein
MSVVSIVGHCSRRRTEAHPRGVADPPRTSAPVATACRRRALADSSDRPARDAAVGVDLDPEVQPRPGDR